MARGWDIRPDQEWMRVSQAARLLDVSSEYIRRQTYAGEFGDYLFDQGLGIRIHVGRFQAWREARRIRIQHIPQSRLEAAHG